MLMNSDGLQPTSDCLRPKSDGLQPDSAECYMLTFNHSHCRKPFCVPLLALVGCLSCPSRPSPFALVYPCQVADIDRFFIAAKVTPAELRKILDSIDIYIYTLGPTKAPG